MGRYMCRRPSWLLLCVNIVVVATPIVPQGPQGDDSILTALTTHQQDLETDGLKFLFDEASKNDFFLLGEVHGDNEIPKLLTPLWPSRGGENSNGTMGILASALTHLWEHEFSAAPH